jgi:hypothetical protein
MSLTSRLDDRDSPVSLFMAAELPGLKELRASYRAQRPAGTSALRPDPPAGVWPAWGTLGQAIDHRLRYAFADLAEPSLAVAAGMDFAAAGPDPAVTGAIALAAWGVRAELAGLVSQELPSGRAREIPLRGSAEEHFLRICYVMAWFEEVYRTGRLWPGTPLGDAGGNLTASQLLAAVPDYAVADLQAQVHLAADRLGGLRAASQPAQVRTGPVFAGSPDVGGADADMIIGDLLLDVKASANATVKREDFYQVIGYVLLDYHDAYQIRRVGLYLARFGRLVTWPIHECLALLGAQRDLAELRKVFAGTVAPSQRRWGTPAMATARGSIRADG